MKNEDLMKLQKLVKRLCRINLDEEYFEKAFSSTECDLLDDFGFDSLLMVQLLVEIEEVFSFEFDMDSLHMEALKNWKTLVKTVDALILEQTYDGQ